LTEALIGKLGYVGIALLLVLGGLGLPVPEEAPIILAAVLSKNEQMWWPIALASCLVGVLLGDFVVYFLGYYHGERVLSLRLTRKFLTRAREAQIKGYFHRHGFKILILGRFAVGFRTAAYLTAGILKLPPLKLFLTDLLAASLSTLLIFGLGFAFAHQIQTSFDQLKHWLMAIVAVALAVWLLHRYYRERQRAGLPVGPPVLVTDDVPLPVDDLEAQAEKSRPLAEGPPAPPAAAAVVPEERALPAADAAAGSGAECAPSAPQPNDAAVLPLDSGSPPTPPQSFRAST
jgi:membrane protein DedA with SNARE-associated domain